jgi:hypothetical protein
MKYKVYILGLSLLILGFNIKAQNNVDGVKILNQTRNSKGTTDGLVEFFIKDKLTKENIPVVIIEFGKIGVIVSDVEGHSTFFARPGKYDIIVKALGYHNKNIKKLKITSKSHFKIEIELEVKPEILN